MDDKPRLRPLDGYPVTVKNQKLLALRDPSGLSEHVATLPPLAVAVLQLCDGDSTRDEICAEFQRRYRQKLERPSLDKLLATLDDALLLDSEKFRQHSAKIFGEWSRNAERPPLHAGRSYPADPEKLRALLDGFHDEKNGPGRPQPGTKPLPRAIISPHVDFQRGGVAYAWAYRPLADAAELPERIVVLGTDHGGLEHPFTLTSKHFETPLGTVKTDVEAVRALVEKTKDLKGCGPALLADEHHHRGEHSIEFQMVWLRYLLGDKLDGIPVLPILCGSLQAWLLGSEKIDEAPAVQGFLDALSSVLAGKRVLWIAGADLAHVGPRYGDQEGLDAEDRGSLERRDQETLKHVVAGDATAWFQEIKREEDRRRVCGLSPIYAMLRAGQPGKGRLAVYAQVPAEESSVVSIASVIYPS